MDFELTEGWTIEEHEIARRAFDAAYVRAIHQLVSTIKEQVGSLNTVESVWEFHDYLSIQRHTIEGRFSFNTEGILFVFASLVKDNLLTVEELAGLDAEKLSKVSAMARF